VENINSKDLAMIRSYANPPELVFFALKPIFYMIAKSVGKKNEDVSWPEIKKFMQRDFIKEVQELKANDIPDNVKDFVLNQYLRTEKWKL